MSHHVDRATSLCIMAGMQMGQMDASLRDPEMQLGKIGDNTVIAGLADPNLPTILSEDDLARLRIRKHLEFELVSSLDKRKIEPRKECWYLVDSDWLNKWSSFMHLPKRLQERAERIARRQERERRRKEKAARRAARKAGQTIPSLDDSTRSTDTTGSLDSSVHSLESNASELDRLAEEEEDNVPPGPISSKNLVNDKGKPLISDLRPIRDYRGVPATTYWVFIELYGKDESPDIPRYEVDIYKPEVPTGRLVNIQFKAKQDARVEVGKIRPKWMKWELSDDEDEEEDKTVCCGLTKEHFETFIYWMVRCCFVSRKSDGRGTIKYSQYSPMMYRDGDSTRGLDSSHGPGSSSHSATGGRMRRDRNSRHGMGGIDSSFHSSSSAHEDSGLDSSHGSSRGSRHGSQHNPLHSSVDEDWEGVGYADRDYDRGTWLERTRLGAWLNGA